jgi:hypothetical protein
MKKYFKHTAFVFTLMTVGLANAQDWPFYYFAPDGTCLEDVITTEGNSNSPPSYVPAGGWGHCPETHVDVELTFDEKGNFQGHFELSAKAIRR